MMKIKFVKVVGQEEEKIFSTAKSHDPTFRILSNFISVHLISLNPIDSTFLFLLMSDKFFKK